MDRLLTEQEIRGIVQNTPAGVYDYEAVAQAQDDLTASLVAQEIIDKLHALWCDIDRRARNSNSIEWTDGMDDANYELQCVITELEAIKSKWGIE